MRKVVSLSIAICMLVGLFTGISTVYANETAAALSADVSTSATVSKVIAFPGAEGGGMYTEGARAALRSGNKMEVYRVTNLNDEGEGSFRDAVSQGNRIVVFDVAGNIHLNSNVNIGHGNMTILGQTAPGDGICFSNNNIKVSGKNVILRYLRFRVGSKMPDGSNTLTQDGMEVTDNAQNIIIDHCSVSWGTDENLSAYAVKDVTIQWSIIAEALNQSIHAKGEHGYGGIWGGVNLSVHHNLIASHKSRNPKIGTSETVAMTAGYTDDQTVVDLRNNIIYNWGDKAGYGLENGAEMNVVNNYYKPGPATPSGKRARIFELSPGNKYQPNWSGKLYASGNFIGVDADDSDKATADLVNSENWQVDKKTGVYLDSNNPSYVKLEAPNTTYLNDYPVNTQTAQDAYDSVLAGAGARLPKLDLVDQRILDNVKNRTAPDGSKGSIGLVDDPIDGAAGAPEGLYDTFGYPKYTYLTAAVIIDTDRDGISDLWEDKMGLNKDNPNDSTNIGPDGYTWLEIYVEEAITKSSANSDTLPQVTLTSPANDEDVSSAMTLSANVTGDNITKVDFYSNDKVIATATTGTNGVYTATVDNPDKGVKYITAKAYNTSGEYMISNINVAYVYGNGDVPPWTSHNVVYENGQYIIGSKGSMFRSVTGDFDFVAGIDEISNIKNGAIAGIAVSPSNSDTGLVISKNYVNYEKKFQVSTDMVDFTDITGGNPETDNLLKISRVGNAINIYTASSLSSWNLVQTTDISSWGDTIDIGALSGRTLVPNVAKFNTVKLITAADKTTPAIIIKNVTDNQRIGFSQDLQVNVTPDIKAKVSEVEVYLNNTLINTYRSDTGIASAETITIPLSFSTIAQGDLKVIAYDENLGVAEDSVTVSVSADLTPWTIDNIGGDSNTMKAYAYCTSDYTYKMYSPDGNISGTSDTYGYMYQNFKDDTRLYYRSRMQGSQSFGIMLKDSLDADGVSYFFGSEYDNGNLVYRLKARETKGGDYTTKATIDSVSGSTNYFAVEKIGSKLNIYKTENAAATSIYQTRTLLESIDTKLGDSYYMGFAAVGGGTTPADAGWISINNIPASGGNSVDYNLNYGLDWTWQLQESAILAPTWTDEALSGNSTGKMLLTTDSAYPGRYVFREYVMPKKIEEVGTKDTIIEGGFKLLLGGDNPGLNAYLQTQAGSNAFKVTFADGIISVNNTALTDNAGAEVNYLPYKWYKASILNNTQIDAAKADIAIYQADSYDGDYTLIATAKDVPYSNFVTINHKETKQPLTHGIYFEPIAGYAGNYYLDDVYVHERLDKDMLTSIVNEASAYNEADYTPISYYVLKNALASANAVLAQENPTSEDISNAIGVIQDAFAELEKIGETKLTSSRMWKFNEGAFSGVTTTLTGTKYDGLTTGGAFAIDTKNVNIDGETFASRLKIGTGSTSSKYVKFDVSGDAVITVYGENAGSITADSPRCVTINDGTEHTTPLTTQMSVTYTYTGPAKTIYVYGTTGGINLYGIKVDEYSDITAPTESQVVNYDIETGVVTAYKADDTNNIAIAVASYSNDGVLTGIKTLSSSFTVGKGHSQDFNVGTVTGDNVKVYLWDGFNSLKPITSVYEQSK